MKTIEEILQMAEKKKCEHAFQWVQKDDGSLGHCPDCFKAGSNDSTDFWKQHILERDAEIKRLDELFKIHKLYEDYDYEIDRLKFQLQLAKDGLRETHALWMEIEKHHQGRHGIGNKIRREIESLYAIIVKLSQDKKERE